MRGANGVIVITTKKGDIGAPKVSVNMEYAVKQPTRLPQFVDAVDFMKIANEANRRTGHNESLPARTDQQYHPEDGSGSLSERELGGRTAQARVDARAHQRQHQRRRSRVRYFISGTYHHENGLYRTDTDREWDANIGMDRVNFRSNLDADITKTTTVNLNIGSQLSINQGPNASSDGDLAADARDSELFHRSASRRPPVGLRCGLREGLNPYNRLTQSGYSKARPIRSIRRSVSRRNST